MRARLAGVWLSALLLVPAASIHALEWESYDGYRRAPLSVTSGGHTGFTWLGGPSLGMAFTNSLPYSRSLTNQIYLNGAGVAAGDVDGDGRVDVFFCGIDRPCALYRNLGQWRFADVTASAGVACEGLAASGATFADIDGDGDLDLIVNTYANGTRVFFNDGKGRFKEAADILNRARAGMSLALADADGDGDLDLYIVNYRFVTIRDQPGLRMKGEYVDGKPVVKEVEGRPTTSGDLMGRFTLEADGRITENGDPAVLLLNDGRGGFSVVPFTGGAFLDEDANPMQSLLYDWGLSVIFRDLNGDGAPDLYICNDFVSPDRFWLNDGHGRFRLISRLGLRSTSLFSMGGDAADLNRDGFDDLFITDMLSPDHHRRHVQSGLLTPTILDIGRIDDRPAYMRNTLQLARGDGTYAEIGQLSGVQAAEWSWSGICLDVDLDGYEDILIPNGHERDAMNMDVVNQAEVIKSGKQLSKMELLELNRLFMRLELPNVAFRNRGDLTFEEVSHAWGFDMKAVSQGMACADLDNDGDLDVLVNNLNGEAGVYRNETSAPRVAVRLRGRAPNTQGIGAKIRVTGGPVPQSQEIICGGRYLSSDQATRTFAAGSPTNDLTLEVTWRSGRRSVVPHARLDSVYEIAEAASQPAPARETPPLKPWFADATDALKHTHVEAPFNDFERQPLLPDRLSQLGPGVAWQDLDNDGREELIIASGKGGRLGVFHNDGEGRFHHLTDAWLSRPAGRDQTTVLGVGQTLFVGLANYEDGTTNGGHLAVVDFARQKSGESVLNPAFSTGALALADMDSDGDLDLFIGGRVVAGRYPEPAASVLLRNDGGRLITAQRFEQLGLVSGAVFSDLDGDGTPELVLACEWGPVCVFRRVNGEYRETTRELGLAAFTGWWHGVTTGDFDGDGRLDIVASNWGLNADRWPTREHPRRLYYGDLGERGMVDVIETEYVPALKADAPIRVFTSVADALPFVRETVASYDEFGRRSVQDVFGERMKTARTVEAAGFESMVFLNRGDHFEARALPGEAQWAPAFGVCVGDADGDSAEDVFLSQNFFATNPDGWRSDAGRGVWLQGDGRGGFRSVPGQESGVMVYGEQRGCALADYDGDGRVDLAVTQNGAATRLFRNAQARPGLRVRLQGPAGNPSGAGAVIQLVNAKGAGPAREIHAGSGYWSQDSAVQVMNLTEPPTRIRVRWPGGRTTETPVPAGAKEIIVRAPEFSATPQ